jgi:hypothetical protein
VFSEPNAKRGSKGSQGPKIKKRNSKKGVDLMKFELPISFFWALILFSEDDSLLVSLILFNPQFIHGFEEL